ncbi:YceI family protein [Oceanihabitans sp. IOP_32]|uniref:YceI family protein n=1 Tax=Oceanihabitans sp. IOP_32 TaxID=2529032 RepID=UPI0012940E9E|nr:YceI family protein [Oceanihabitans sp. IOP_32]QFZ54550.1 YceI family protein [Oceanihabitans sp. IOP_32]
MLSYFVLILSIGFSCLGFAQNASAIDFTIRNMGFNVEGRFETYSITTQFNKNGNLDDLSAKIEVASIQTGIEARDQHLLEADYFHAEKYKDIKLQSVLITKKSDSSYLVKATLRIKGITKTIIFPVQVEKHPHHYKITSNFELNRRDFDVGGGSFIMGKSVKVKVVYFQDL